MLYRNAQKTVEHRKRCDTQMHQELYNIENDVIHKWAKKCITSKTMLYTKGQKVYYIENDVIQNLHSFCIKSKTD